jgi:hypothetical protein
MIKIGNEQYDFNQLYEDAKLGVYPDVAKATFLDHCLPYLASIPILGAQGNYSPSSMMGILKEGKLGTPNGEVDAKEVSKMVGFLYLCPRSKLVNSPMSAHARLGSLTPLVLYANKLHHGVGYEQWDKTDLYMGSFLGKFLEPILKYKNEFDDISASEARGDMLTTRTGAKAGEMASITAYKANRINKLDVAPVCARIKYQTWIANSKYRTDSMILDLENWDYMPESIDVLVKKKTKTVIPEKKVDELQF